MTHALIVQTRKEVRALLPWTTGVAFASVALAYLARQNAGFPNFRYDQAVFFIMAYVLGVLSVAALSVGQELSHGTLGSLLAQPIDRRRVLGLKLLVLTTAVVSLGLIANAFFPRGYLPNDAVSRRLLIWAPVAVGIGLVPLLTVMSRRPLGGMVFGVAIPGLILFTTEYFYPLQQGLQALNITWWGTLATSAIGLGALVVTFGHLEVAGNGGQRASAFSPPKTLDLATADYQPTVRRSWAWLLIKKELRLQQMTFAVSGLYLVAAIAVMVTAHNNPAYVGPTFGALSILHAYFLPLIAGAVSSAEERHLGTLAGQILMPRNMRLQWAIKVVVTVGVALTLTIGLPLVLMAIHRPVDAFHVEFDFSVGIAMLCVAAMFVSSISSNSLWALLGCFPVIGLAAMIGSEGRTLLLRQAYRWFPWHYSSWALKAIRVKEPWFQNWMAARSAAWRDIEFSLGTIEISLIVGFGLLVLYFAARNHRALDRNLRTVASQLLVLLLFATVATLGYLVTSRVADQWMAY